MKASLNPWWRLGRLGSNGAVQCDVRSLGRHVMHVILGMGALSGVAVAIAANPLQDEQTPPPPRGAVQGEVVQEQEDDVVPLPFGNRQIGRLRGMLGGPGMLQFNQAFGGPSGNRSISRSVANGITTTTVRESDREIKIEETPDGIFMEVTRSYTKDDLESLRDSHPELAKALEAFPNEADGQSVQVSVRAISKYEAINPDDLQEEHPEAFKEFQRIQGLMSNSGSDSGFGGVLGFQGMDLEMGDGFRMQLQEMDQLRDEMERRMERMLERIR